LKSHDDINLLLLLGKGESSRIVYHHLSSTFLNIVCIQEDKPDKWKFWKRRMKKLGMYNVLGQILFLLVGVPVLSRFSKKRRQEIINKYDLKLDEIPSTRITHVSSVNSEKARQIVEQEKPDIVLVNGTRILSRRLLSLISAPIVNTHLGITPAYRGVHGGYWSMAQSDHENFGTTIHLVDAGVDTGGILHQEYVTPDRKDNYCTYPILQLAQALEPLKEVIIKVVNNEHFRSVKNDNISRQWYHPTLWGYLFLRLFKGVK